MADVLIVPPFRTPLLTANGVPLSGLDAANGDKSAGGPPGNRTSIETTRDWWLYWRTLAEFANAGVNMLTYGNSFDRPDAGGMPDGAIYVNADQSGVIYQNQGGEWHYIAGTMYGTLSPDQRPVGLGVNDAGFDFRTIDTNPLLGAREFIWSGTAWVEATPVLYGTHATRPAAASAPPRCIYVETDRGGVIYQNQGGTWHFLAGTMWGTLSPDQRPTDLGVNDAGFDFRSTDPPPREYIWSGTAWVAATPALDNLVLLAYGTTIFNLTTTPQNIPGAALTLTRAGTYHISATFYLSLDAVDNGQTLIGQLDVAAGHVAAFFLQATTATVNAGGTVSQQWLYTATAGAVINLQAYKSGGTGGSRLIGTHTSIAALWVSP